MHRIGLNYEKLLILLLSFNLFSAISGGKADASATVEITEAQLKGAVEEFLLSVVSESPEKIEISCRRHGGMEVQAEGSLEIRPSLVSGERLRGRIPVRVELWNKGKPIRQLMVTADIRFYEAIAVAARRLGRHEAVASEMLKFERRDVTEYPGGYFTRPEDLIGMRTKRSIPYDRMLTKGCVEKIPVVLRGTQVALVAETKNVHVSAIGIAKADGGIGDRIPVMNKDSRKRVTAEVIDAQTVRVFF